MGALVLLVQFIVLVAVWLFNAVLWTLTTVIKIIFWVLEWIGRFLLWLLHTCARLITRIRSGDRSESF